MRHRYWFSPWLLFLFLYLLMGGTLVKLHCYPSARIVQQSQQQYWRRIPVKANRGIIQDCKGNALVISEVLSSLGVDPSLLSSEDAFALQAVMSEDILSRLAQAKGSQFMWLRRKLVPPEGDEIRALNLKAILNIAEQDRRYPNQSLLAHVLGFCDIDNRGQAGIEQAWDSILYNPPGYRIVIRRPGAHSASLVSEEAEKKSVTPVLTLTIDSRIQYVVEKHLFSTARKQGAKWGAAICMDPWSGAILAMASWPAFNPQDRRTLAPEATINNSVSRGYEPGSTFKPIFMGIALERGWVRQNEIFHCPAKIKVADGYVAEAYPKAMGDIDTAHLLIKSSNVGMAQIGVRAEKVKMYESLRAWGFGRESDIELPGVAKGIIPFPEQWRGVVPANIAIGQGLAVTPLQLLVATAPIVNGGKLMSPYILKEAVNASGEIVYRGEPRVMREVLTAETAHWLRKAMKATVTEGTGRRAQTEVTTLAGKTGTAQVPEGGKYSAKRYVASFIGFWPYEEPRYLMLLVIGEPTSGRYYGGELAAPPFKAIVEEIAELEYYEARRKETP